jgi:hypothetical protein
LAAPDESGLFDGLLDPIDDSSTAAIATAPPTMTGVLVRSISTPLRQAEAGIAASRRFQKESEGYYWFTNKLRACGAQIQALI